MRFFLIFLGLWVSASPATAQRLEWSPEWNRPGLQTNVASGALITGAFAIALTADSLSHNSHWRGTGPIDEAVTEGLSLRTPRARRRAAIASYFTGVLALSSPVGGIGVALADNTQFAADLTQIATLSLASVTLATTFIKYIALRRRPNAGECTTPDCAASRYRSFPSGHSSLAFMGASLACTYHVRVGVFGNRAGDIAACGTAVAFALTTAVLRVVARKHYLSDVLVGSALGILAGWVLPTLLYFGFGSD